MSAAVFQISKRNKLQANRIFPAFMTPVRNKHQRSHSLIDGSLHKNFVIQVKKSLNRGNQRSSKDKFPYFDDVITLMY